MNKAYLKFYNFLLRRSYVSQIILFYLLSFFIVILSIPLQLFAVEFAGNEYVRPKSYNVIALLALAPVIETLIFQHWVFKILEKINWGRHKYLWIITISAVLFGSSHFYSLRYIVFATAMGFVLGYVYYFYSKNSQKAYWTTVLIHFLYNCTAALVVYKFTHSN